MTLHTFPGLPQRSEEWLEQRRGMVTASMVGNLLSIGSLSAIDYACPSCKAPANDLCRSKRNPDATIKTLHSERAEYARSQPSSLVIEPASNDVSRGLTRLLAAERINGWVDDGMFVNFEMQRGIDDEPRARDKYSEHYAPVTEVGLMVEDKWGFRIGYSPDGLVGDDGLIEVKSHRPKIHLGIILADAAPMENMAQLQCGLLVSGRKWVDYISYCGGMRLWRKRVHPQRIWFDAIIAAVRKFEENAAEAMRQYDEAVVGLPMTERTVYVVNPDVELERL